MSAYEAPAAAARRYQALVSHAGRHVTQCGEYEAGGRLSPLLFVFQKGN